MRTTFCMFNLYLFFGEMSMYFAHVLIGLFAFLLLNLRVLISTSLVLCQFANVAPSLMLFHYRNTSFKEKFKKIIKCSQLSIISFMDCACDVKYNNPFPSHWSGRFFIFF